MTQNWLEYITHNDELYAIIVRNQPIAVGVNFVTPDEAPLQLGVSKYAKGHVIQAHTHRPRRRTFSQTGEVIVVREGRGSVQLFTLDGEFVTRRELLGGDVVCLVAGYHRFDFSEDTTIIEVKSGPYEGDDKDYKDSRP